MKLLLVYSILAATALGQAPGKTVTFNQADAAHCKVVSARGKPLLQSTYDGITVAIAMPLNRGNGDFSIFAIVSRASGEPIEVDPKNFYGLFSDKNHTRFQFYDMAAQTDRTRPPGANPTISAANSRYDPSTVSRIPPGSGRFSVDDDRSADTAPPSDNQNMSAVFFRKGKIRQGSSIAGWITLRPPKGPKLEIHSSDMLDEIDIRVNGVTFRF